MALARIRRWQRAALPPSLLSATAGVGELISALFAQFAVARVCSRGVREVYCGLGTFAFVQHVGLCVCVQTDSWRLQTASLWQIVAVFRFFVADGRPRRSSRSQQRGYGGKCKRTQGLFTSPTQAASCPAFCLVSAVFLPSFFSLSPSCLFCILRDALPALVLGSLKVTQAAGIWRRKRVNC